MSTRAYTLPVEQTRWYTPFGGSIAFTWEYDESRDKLLALYEKGKNQQWNASTRIDWSLPCNRDNPLAAPDIYNPIWGSKLWDRMNQKERDNVRFHSVAWQFSQFLHGEQGALICAAKIVQTVPDLDSKFYAATQVMDEARHVEVYSRYLHEKLELAYPINPYLKTLLDQVLRDTRWDFTYLGMQVLIEGLALAAFGMIRDLTTDPLAVALNAYVMQDEARHVAFGRFALRDYYPQLSDAERGEREEFCVEACYLMRDRFLAEEMWRHLELGDEAIEAMRNSVSMKEFQKALFSRIVPVLREIGLWGPKVRKAFEDMGVIEYAKLDMDVMSVSDEQRATEIDREKAKAAAGVAGAIALGRGI